MAVKAVMAAWFKVADQRAVRAAATLCWRVAGACLVRALAKPSMKVAASSLQLPSFSIVSASTLRRWLLSRDVLFCFCVHLHTRPLRSFPWVGFLWWVWMASNWQSRWQWPRRCSMTSTERLPAVESFTLKTSTMFQCFAAQDTSLERSVVAKAESCRRNVFPFHVSFYWSRATVPNHRVERIQCQTIASWRKPMRLTTWSSRINGMNPSRYHSHMFSLWYRNFVTDSWDFHGKTKTKHDCVHRWCKVRMTWLSKSWFGFSPHRRCACVLMFSVPCPSTKRALSLNPASGPQWIILRRPVSCLCHPFLCLCWDVRQFRLFCAMLQASCNLFGLFPGAFPFLSVHFGKRQNAHVEGSYGIKGTVHMAMCLWFWRKHHNYNMVANVHSQHVFNTSIFLFRSLDEQWPKEPNLPKPKEKSKRIRGYWWYWVNVFPLLQEISLVIEKATISGARLGAGMCASDQEVLRCSAQRIAQICKAVMSGFPVTRIF